MSYSGFVQTEKSVSSSINLSHVLFGICTNWKVCQFQHDYQDPRAACSLLLYTKLLNNLKSLHTDGDLQF